MTKPTTDEAIKSRCSGDDGTGSEHISNLFQARFVVESKRRSVEQDYDVEVRPIGRGGYGSVKRGKCKATGDVKAVKSVLKSKVGDLPELLREMEVIRMMDHPNIVKVFGAYQDESCLYLVLELLEGGTLGDRLQEARRFEEPMVAHLMSQIFSALCHIHETGFVHRDLKLDNFIFQSAARVDRNTLKLIDFGLSKYLPEGKFLESVVGSAAFVAPEVMDYKSGKPSDLWSCGAIMYTLFSGSQPFTGLNDRQVLQKAKKGEYRLTGRIWEPVSTEAKDLIRRLLVLGPEKRCSAQEALDCDWLRNHRAAGMSSQPFWSPELLQNMDTFSKASRFKKAALLAAAHSLGEGEAEHLQAAFRAVDTNGDGALSLMEIREAFSKCHEHLPDLEHVLTALDVNKDGEVSYTEFLAAAMDQQLADRRDYCRRAFNAFDLDGNGTVDLNELRAIMEDEGKPSSAADSLVANSSSGVLSFEEFQQLLREQSCTGSGAANPTSLREAGSSGCSIPEMTPPSIQEPPEAGSDSEPVGAAPREPGSGAMVQQAGGYGMLGRLTRRCFGGGYPS